MNNTLLNNAENLDIIMRMYNLLEYGDNYSMASGSLWNCYRGEANFDTNEIVANYRIKKTRQQQ